MSTLKEFLETYQIPLATLVKIRNRVMIVGRFNGKASDGAPPDLYLFSKQKPSPSYLKNFKAWDQINYSHFVSRLAPKWSERVEHGKYLDWVIQTVPEKGTEGKVLINESNYAFVRAIANSDQPAFQEELPNLSLKDEQQEGRVVFQHLRECLKKFALLQSRSFELVDVFAKLLAQAVGPDQIPMTYSYGRSLPTGLHESLLESLYAENDRTPVDLSRVIWTEGIWNDLENKDLLKEMIQMYRGYLLTGKTDGYNAISLTDGGAASVLDDLFDAHKGLLEEYREARLSLNGLRQLLRAKNELFRVLEWLFNSLYDLDPVKSLSESGERDEAVLKAIMQDWESLGLKAPVKRPAESEQREFRKDLLQDVETLIEALASGVTKGLPTHLQAVLSELPSDSRRVLEALCGRDLVGGAKEQQKAAFLGANRAILIDIILETMFQSPDLSEDRLIDHLKVAFSTSYLTSVLLSKANKEELRNVAVMHAKSLQDQLDKAGGRLKDAKTLRRHVIFDYFKTIGSEALGQQMLSAVSALHEILPLVAANSQQHVFGGLQTLFALPAGQSVSRPSKLAAKTVPATPDLVMVAVDTAFEMRKTSKMTQTEAPVASTPGSQSKQTAEGTPKKGKQEIGDPLKGAGPNGKQEERDENKPAESARQTTLQDRINKIVSKISDRDKAIEEVNKSDIPKRLSEGVMAYRSAVQLIYDRYRENREKHTYRNVVDRMTLSGLMLGMQDEIGVGDNFSNLLQLVLDMVATLNPDNPQAREFFSEHSLTEYFRQQVFEPQDGTGITELGNALRAVSQTSSDNVVRIVSELRGIKFLFDRLNDRPEVEIVVVNATGSEFLNWVSSESLFSSTTTKPQQTWRRLRAGQIFNDTTDETLFPGLLILSDMEGKVTRKGAERKVEEFLKACATFALSNGGQRTVLPPICLSTTLDADWYETGSRWAKLAEDAVAPIMVVGPPPRLNRATDRFNTYLPGGYLLACHFLGGVVSGLDAPNSGHRESRGRFQIIHSDGNRLADTLEAVFWPGSRIAPPESEAEPVTSKESRNNPQASSAANHTSAYSLAADQYLFLVALIWAAARSRMGKLAQGLPATKFFDYFHLSQSTMLQFESSAELDKATYGGLAQRFSISTRQPLNSKNFGVEIAAADEALKDKTPRVSSDQAEWFVRMLNNL